MPEPSRIEVEDYMLLCLGQLRVDMWTCTALAETAAENFSCRHWLEDETHWIWETAANIYSNAYEKGFDN